jgi:hypothetical protein
MKISNKKNSFFSTRNQYFPHIPYVASKKTSLRNLNFKILSMRCIKLARKTQEAKISGI